MTIATCNKRHAPRDWATDASTTAEGELEHLSATQTVESTGENKGRVRAVRIAGNGPEYVAWSAIRRLAADGNLPSEHDVELAIENELLGMHGSRRTTSDPADAGQLRLVLESRKDRPSHRCARTPLGRRLMEIRQGILANGQPLLDWQQLDAEVKTRRNREVDGEGD